MQIDIMLRNALFRYKMWVCPVIHFFWTEVVIYISFVLKNFLIFAGAHVLLIYIPVGWELSDRQQKWGL